jgi:hypothetical protein
LIIDTLKYWIDFTADYQKISGGLTLENLRTSFPYNLLGTEFLFNRTPEESAYFPTASSRTAIDYFAAIFQYRLELAQKSSDKGSD